MKMLFVCYDVLTLLILASVAFVFLCKSGHVQAWRQVVLTAGLIGVSVFGAIGALAVGATQLPVPVWLRGLLTAGCIVAVFVYDYRFGRKST